MSADRFFAVWYPIKSLRYRATKFAVLEVALTWVVSFALMIPIVLYAQHMLQNAPPGQGPRPGPSSSSDGVLRYSCQVHWPAEHPVTAVRIYFVYNLLVGFVLPVALIFVFYLLLVLRLRSKRLTLRPGGGGSERKPRGRRSVTTLVTVIISVFIVCWLPYWVFQAHIVFGGGGGGPLPDWCIYLFQFFTVLTYSNSAINPLLYAFTNDSFKKAFVAACRCSRLTSDPEVRSETASGVGGGCRPKKGVAVAGAGAGGSGSRRRLQLKAQATVLYDFSGSGIADAADKPEVEETGNADGSGEKLVPDEEMNPKASEETFALYNETSSQMLGAI